MKAIDNFILEAHNEFGGGAAITEDQVRSIVKKVGRSGFGCKDKGKPIGGTLSSTYQPSPIQSATAKARSRDGGSQQGSAIRRRRPNSCALGNIAAPKVVALTPKPRRTS